MDGLKKQITRNVLILGSRSAVVCHNRDLALQASKEFRDFLRLVGIKDYKARNGGRVLKFGNGSKVVFIVQNDIDERGKYTRYRRFDWP
jgi:hypothetical protein